MHTCPLFHIQVSRESAWSAEPKSQPETELQQHRGNADFIFPASAAQEGTQEENGTDPELVCLSHQLQCNAQAYS